MAAQVADAVALAAFAVFFWQLFFLTREAFDPLAASAGGVAITAAVLARRRVSTIVDGPLAIFAGLTILSAVVNHGRYATPSPAITWFASWKPAFDVLVRVVCFYGLASLLRTRRRLGVFIAFIVFAASVTGVQTIYDHTNHGWRTRLWLYPSVPTWIGYPTIAMVIVIALALTLPVAIASRSPVIVLASSLLALVFAFDLAFLYSRAGYVSAAATAGALGAIEVWTLKTRRLFSVMAIGVILAAAVLLVSPRTLDPLSEFWVGSFYNLDTKASTSSRAAIWTRALKLIRAHPLLGVGVGNYSDAISELPIPGPPRDSYSVGAFNAHAHNIVLQVAAESGIPGVIAFLLIWWRMLNRLSRSWSRTSTGVLSLALSCALFSIFVGSLSQYQMRDGMIAAERMSFLLWTLLAAAAALARLQGNDKANAAALA